MTSTQAQGITREMVNRIVLGFAPEQAILFGSYARGTETRDSDVDIRVALHGMGLAKDIVLRTPDELAAEKDIPGTIGLAIEREGSIVFFL